MADSLVEKIAMMQKQQEQGIAGPKNVAMGLNPDGSPQDITFQSLIDPATGKLKSQYQLQAQPDVQVDQRAIDEIRNRGLSKDPSAWAQAAYGKQGLEETGALDKARMQQQGAQDQSLNQLMMSGGLSGGGRERLAAQGNKNLLMASQDVGRQGQMARAGIDVQDQADKNNFLTTTADLDFKNANVGIQNRQYQTGVDQTNLQNQLGENQAQRNFDSGVYGQKLNKWAAGKQADAQSGNHGKK